MDIKAFRRYASSFPALRGGLPQFAAEALEKVFLPAGKAGVEESWLESSVASAGRPRARFIHYYRAKGGLGAGGRLRVWDAAYARFLGLLGGPAAGGRRFSLRRALGLRDALRGRLERHSGVIASAEWLPGASGFSKATVYVVTEKPLPAEAARELAALAGDGDPWTGPASSSDMGFLGADFLPGGGLEFKVYRRYLPGRPALEPAAARAWKELSRAGAVTSVHKVYKYARGAGRTFLDKTHFTLGPRTGLGELAAAGGEAGAAAARAFRGLSGELRPTFLGIAPGGGAAEIYFG